MIQQVRQHTGGRVGEHLNKIPQISWLTRCVVKSSSYIWLYPDFYLEITQSRGENPVLSYLLELEILVKYYNGIPTPVCQINPSLTYNIISDVFIWTNGEIEFPHVTVSRPITIREKGKDIFTINLDLRAWVSLLWSNVSCPSISIHTSQM